MNSRTDTILIIDDDDSDMELALRIIRQSAPLMKIVTLTDGAAALDYLFPSDHHAAVLHLHDLKLVLLDLHMPGIDGFEVLKRIKADPVIRTIPVVIFTSSKEMKDVEYCYRYGANSYIVKPINMEEYEQAVASIINYWSLFNETVGEVNVTPHPEI